MVHTTFWFFSDLEGSPKKLMAKSRHVIIVYTPGFIKSCSENDTLLIRGYNKMFTNKQLVYVCTRPTQE